MLSDARSALRPTPPPPPPLTSRSCLVPLSSCEQRRLFLSPLMDVPLLLRCSGLAIQGNLGRVEAGAVAVSGYGSGGESAAPAQVRGRGRRRRRLRCGPLHAGPCQPR
ncbi:hypothetical protein PLESTB_000881400 [Pleodorina starrii]|uniref:Uncharacterized protein n=1 Tax=Pleodorina starrii TaxID=330485 RepID=A0A9W6BN07_9CHLO|nr:hypothetical protein PLESTM_001004700 [Pleodorina starrii]GLC54577.1 hypothetical protein PLESTB_000881400 [Pleodorina starrii]GLC67873.1 hypothetical protein PLESTF_000617900 [Pleodorina starrii]